MSGRCLWSVWNSTSSKLRRANISQHFVHIAKCSFSSGDSFSYSSSVIPAFDPIRQTQSCARDCRSNPKHESHRNESTLGFRHRQWPDVSPGTPAQRREPQKTFQPHACGLISISVIAASGSLHRLVRPIRLVIFIRALRQDIAGHGTQ